MAMMVREAPARPPEMPGQDPVIDRAAPEYPMPAIVKPQARGDGEDVLVEAAAQRNPPDWEGLIAVGTTPALVIGGERRLRRS